MLINDVESLVGLSKKSIRYYVADQVISYIEENHIYSPVKEKG